VTANVSGNEWIGGIIGSNYGRIYGCRSDGQVTGNQILGGLAGRNAYWEYWNTLKGEIKNSYSTCRVSGTSRAGGLVGESQNQTSITHCYSIGPVTGISYIGGLLGINYGATVLGCFWDQDTSGLSVSAGGTGLSTALMQDPATYQNAGWDLVNIWRINGGPDYPRLRSLDDTAEATSAKRWELYQ
jgi:hypothetical protein